MEAHKFIIKEVSHSKVLLRSRKKEKRDFIYVFPRDARIDWMDRSNKEVVITFTEEIQSRKIISVADVICTFYR